MKLLLTSNGVCSPELVSALLQLAGHPASELKLVFIPTAANIEDEDKSWLIENLEQLKELEFAKLDIVDIASVDKEIWQPRINQADILVFGGGDTAYLVNLMRHIKFDEYLQTWLKTKILVGISAGSVMCGPIINPKKDIGLGLVNFLIIPHKGAPYAHRTTDQVEDYAHQMNKKAYWIDDQSAIKVNGDLIEVVGTGRYEVFEL